RARTRRGAGRSTGGRPRRRQSGGQPGAGAGSGSGAVPAEHLRLVLQLAPVLDEVAVRADELGRLRGHHLDREGLQALLTGQSEDGVVLLLGLLGAGLLLDQDVLDRFDVLVATGARGRGRRGRQRVLVGGAGLGTILVDLFVFERVFEVFHRAIPLFGRGIVLPGISLATVPREQRRSEVISFPDPIRPSRRTRRGAGRGTRRARDRCRNGEMRTQETFGAAAPGRRVLYSASWVLRAPAARGGRRSAEVYAGSSGCQMRRYQTAYTSRPRLTVSTGRTPSSELTASGSTS